MSACTKATQEQIEPKVTYSLPVNRLKQLPATFTELSEAEKKEEWGKEYFIGTKLAQKFDLYRAVTAFKRAEILIPGYLKQRLFEIQYYITLSYFLGEKYDDVIASFEQSDLIQVDHEFKGYRNLLVVLHESFQKTKQVEKAKLVLKLLEEEDQKLGQIVKVSHAIANYEKSQLEQLNFATEVGKDTKDLMDTFEQGKKSEFKAQFYNAILPGSGYLYLGQKQAAVTAFLLNGLTTYAAYYFFTHGNIPAGVLMASIETGWYFGGINGAKESAKLYNERLYENRAQPIIQKHSLHPVFHISHAF